MSHVPAVPASMPRAAGPRQRLLLLGTAVLLAGWILLVYRLVPGQIPNAQFFIADAAYAECLQESARAGLRGCFNTGFPAGAPKPFGLPVNTLAQWVFAGDGTVSMAELRIVYGGILLAAFALSCVLFARVVGDPWLGLCGAAMYLMAPAVQLQSSFGALQLGMALLPGYLLLDASLSSTLAARRWRLLPLTIAAIAAVRVLALFLDGYSFLLSCTLSATFFGLSALRGNQRSASVIALAIYAAAAGCAALIYRHYLDAAALAVMPIDFFRGAGVDIATMLLPLQWQGGWGLLGIGLDITPEMSWGARSSLLGVFTGYSYLGAIALLAWSAWKRRLPDVHRPLLGAIVLAGLFGTLLSLGPSLKVMDFRDPARAPASIERMMPAARATASLHTDWIYQSVPGIRNARVLARWQVLTRLALVAILLSVAAHLLRTQRRAAAALLLAMGLFEMMPDPVENARTGQAALVRAQWLYHDVADAFGSRLVPGERVFLLQLHDDAAHNEFASNTLCVRARVHCYNTGGDKAAVIVQRSWPTAILAAKEGRDVASNIASSFARGDVDVVVVPLFDLREIVYPHRVDATSRDQVVERARELSRATGMPLQVDAHFAYLRPIRGGDHP